jgi:hypothetical protein
VPPGIAVAPDLPDLLPAVNLGRGIIGFLRRHPTIAVGGTLLILMLLMAVLAPYLGTVDPTALATARRTRPPSAEHWFGTDMLGRDLYSRVIYGARVSLLVGFSVAAFASVIGLAIGLFAGFVRWADAILMRVMDGLMSIPPILLAVALMALTRGSVGDVIVAITIAEIPRVSRLVRSVVLVAARPTLCRYGGGGRHPYADDHPAAHLAEHASADDRAGDLYLRQRHDRRGDPVFHRRWNAADYAILGQHHGRGPRTLAGEALYRFLPRRVPVRHRAGCQSARRQIARCARPTHGQRIVIWPCSRSNSCRRISARKMALIAPSTAFRFM